MKYPFYLIFIIVLMLYGCGGDTVPKPKAFLRLDYPESKYVEEDLGMPFSFEKNLLATKQIIRKVKSSTESYGIDLEYPTMKGTIFLTYKSIENNKENLLAYLRDAQNFTQKHTMKADEIKEQAYVNKKRKVFGMLYEVGGNAASQSQFYVTDSVNHFLTGSLYFYAKPNYDSILPAANYLQKDIEHIMESIKWK